MSRRDKPQSEPGAPEPQVPASPHGPIEVRIVNSAGGWHEPVAAFSAIVVALAALGVSLWQGYLQYRNNKTSVRPILVGFSDFVDATEQPGLLIENRGIGPAIIKSAEIYVRNSPIGTMTHQTWDEAMRVGGIFNDVRAFHWSIEQDFPMNPGSQMLLFGLSKGWRRSAIPQLQQFVQKDLRVDLCYCSLYADCWTLIFEKDTYRSAPAKCE